MGKLPRSFRNGRRSEGWAFILLGTISFTIWALSFFAGTEWAS